MNIWANKFKFASLTNGPYLYDGIVRNVEKESQINKSESTEAPYSLSLGLGYAWKIGTLCRTSSLSLFVIDRVCRATEFGPRVCLFWLFLLWHNALATRISRRAARRSLDPDFNTHTPQTRVFCVNFAPPSTLFYIHCGEICRLR